MISLKAIRTRHFNASIHNFPLIFFNSTNSSEFMYISSISRRPFSHSAPNADEKICNLVEPLGGFFRRVIFGEERTDTNRAVAENTEMEVEERSLGDKLRNLEEEVRDLNQKRCETVKKLQLLSEKVDPVGKREKRSLSALFYEKGGQSKSKSKSVAKSKSESKSVSESKPVAEPALVDQTAYGMEDPMIHRELSPDMKIFAEHLYAKGYLENASFLRKNKFDPTCFEIGYAREFLKFAASNFGDDHLEIAGWLSAGDLKKIALFGCPNLGQKTVYAAKHMRTFFKIDEHKVCQACTLKEMCKHRNKGIKKQSTKLHLGSAMKVLVIYAMESVPQDLEVPQEIKDSASRLLKEIVSLSQEKS